MPAWLIPSEKVCVNRGTVLCSLNRKPIIWVNHNMVRLRQSSYVQKVKKQKHLCTIQMLSHLLLVWCLYVVVDFASLWQLLLLLSRACDSGFVQKQLLSFVLRCGFPLGLSCHTRLFKPRHHEPQVLQTNATADSVDGSSWVTAKAGESSLECPMLVMKHLFPNFTLQYMKMVGGSLSPNNISD